MLLNLYSVLKINMNYFCYGYYFLIKVLFYFEFVRVVFDDIVDFGYVFY